MLDTISDERGAASADMALAIIRRVFNWHASRSDDFRSPIVPGMARLRRGGQARSRILTDDEIRTVWRTAEEQGDAFGRMVRFLLLTGARRAEAAGMRWAELDGADWLLPAARNKTKVDLLRPLPQAALAVIGDPSASPFVFTNDGIRALRGYGPLKVAFDRATGPMPRWTLHDCGAPRVRSCPALASRATTRNVALVTSSAECAACMIATNITMRRRKPTPSSLGSLIALCRASRPCSHCGA